MNRKPLISVVIIFLNAERFIAEAIESVFGQNYDDWELLLVDDGSSDISSSIARRYTEEHPGKVYYFEHAGHENRGMSASRNLGIRHARGQYIALLDADDVRLPKKLEYQVEILSRYPEAGMVVGPIQWWYSWTGKPDDFARDFVAPFPPELPSDSLVEPPKLLISLLRQATVSATSSLLRREVVDFVGGYEEDFRGMFEDQAFAAKVYLTAPVFVAADCHYKWRKHPNSCCAVAVETAQYEHARFDFLRWLQRYLSQRQISHIELECTLENELCKSHQWHPGLGNSQNWANQIKALAKSVAHRFIPQPFDSDCGNGDTGWLMPASRTSTARDDAPANAHQQSVGV